MKQFLFIYRHSYVIVKVFSQRKLNWYQIKKSDLILI